jgi:hypothetical protein
VGHFLFAGAWAAFVSILVSYHLFLAWLVVTAEHKTGFSLPIISTNFTHMACLVLVVGIPIERHHIPFFWLIRYCIPALAPFECTWLFSGNKRKETIPVAAPPSAADTKAAAARAIARATADDHEAWIHYLSHRDPKSRKPGMSVKEEYEQWMLARAKNQPARLSNNTRA